MYRVLCAYLKQQYSSLTAYKSAFCMTLVNVFIRIYAYAMLWMTLYKQNASLFGNIDLNQMLLYSIFSISLSQAFTWWDGPHIYVEENIKNGRIICDLLKPMELKTQLFLRTLSSTVVNLCIFTIPSFLISTCFFKLELNVNIIGALITFVLGFLLLFSMNYILSLICFLSLDLEGYLYIFHALIAFCSGQVVPLWFYPDFLLEIINWLPFKYVFYEPLLLFIRNGNLFQTVCFQVIWIFILSLIGALFAAKMLHIQITVGFMLGFIVSIINGVYVFTAILFSVSCISFWTMKSKSILYSTNEIQESVQHYPISIFNKAFKFIVTVLLPYGLVNYYPSLILLNKVNVHWVYVIMIALVDMIYGVIGAFLWRRGLKRYNGSGS